MGKNDTGKRLNFIDMEKLVTSTLVVRKGKNIPDIS
jgi:hypothetical protein